MSEVACVNLIANGLLTERQLEVYYKESVRTNIDLINNIRNQ